MKSNLGSLLFAIAVVAFFGFGLWWTMQVWNECRLTNSWMYCLRLISK
jgi:hypothetical protein